jgi:signal peptidase II
VAVAVVATDHLTKWLAQRELVDHDVHLISTLRFHLVHNKGTAFGLGSKYAPLIALAASIVVITLVTLRQKVHGWGSNIAVGAVAGGAIGNLLDRLFRDGTGFLGGSVIDFIDFQWWPVFNVADMAITLGAVALALTAARE